MSGETGIETDGMSVDPSNDVEGGEEAVKVAQGNPGNRAVSLLDVAEPPNSGGVSPVRKHNLYVPVLVVSPTRSTVSSVATHGLAGGMTALNIAVAGHSDPLSSEAGGSHVVAGGLAGSDSALGLSTGDEGETGRLVSHVRKTEETEIVELAFTPSHLRLWTW